MHDLIVSPFLDDHLVLMPGRTNGFKLPRHRYLELADAPTNAPIPDWLVTAADRAFNLNLTGRPLHPTALIRRPSPYGCVRASYELNLGCNYDCEHCYLGERPFAGLDWPGRERLLHIMRDAGVVWVQLTGGEPLIDRLFPDVHRLAYELGMMISISSNGSRLSNPHILDLLTTYRPYRLTLSVYGATEESYDGMTRRRGSYRRFVKGLDAAVEADLPVQLSVVVSSHNTHEIDAMVDMAESRGITHHVYVNMSPTIHGDGSVLTTQSAEHLRERKVFTGCNAGHTFFHADPHGRASICKIGRDDAIDLISEGVEGLSRLGEIADRLMLRTGGCSGCALSGSCTVCRPLAKQYQQAKAPLQMYCQHGKREEVTT
ncbi:MoaA/NifB/PqqE/SkfB family radical SAM enzyme [Spinactinospora alkalitolerans]|uniref:MoaA/NifB/PqqE/SkfB family radical SAM enzyme n=1 Tax=Spinactinospora alkalitolerans TaxID=687207 RepID=A0A852TZ59_9ACTN|nr:radical SAM protein [Spinactinospora alkalitolerans]NYE48073.1 MoaA/NifB/PqqE/SkfB family radical SAM enzyme [Spinactinospora alkalitolerans]